jgi:hypothetical protein
VSPAGGEVGVGDFGYAGERHDVIIDSRRDGLDSCGCPKVRAA